nr:reverse transcriptase domain-containing protein [Tanacetum cinerariifolium]
SNTPPNSYSAASHFGGVTPAMPKDIPEPAQEGEVEVIEGVQREQGHKIVGVESTITALTERVVELERDNRRLRGTASVESQRVDRLQHGMSLISRYPQILPSAMLLCYRKMPNTRSRASMTHDEVKELVARRVAEEMEACEAARNLKNLSENGDKQEGENGGNENRGNRGNGNRDNRGNGGNGNHGMNYGGVVGLTCWLEKMETVFNISNCPLKYQVKYATCTLQNSALTWWNSHKRKIGVDVAYAKKWAGLMKLMTEGYTARSAENKRRMESNPRDNCEQQPLFKKQNSTGQNVARAYTAGNNERMGYVGSCRITTDVTAF